MSATIDIDSLLSGDDTDSSDASGGGGFDLGTIATTVTNQAQAVAQNAVNQAISAGASALGLGSAGGDGGAGDDFGGAAPTSSGISTPVVIAGAVVAIAAIGLLVYLFA